MTNRVTHCVAITGAVGLEPTTSRLTVGAQRPPHRENLSKTPAKGQGIARWFRDFFRDCSASEGVCAPLGESRGWR